MLKKATTAKKYLASLPYMRMYEASRSGKAPRC